MKVAQACRLLALAMGIVAPVVGSAAENLLALYREAQAANAAYLAARAGTEADREYEHIALGQLLPSLNYSANLGRNGTQRTTGSFPTDQLYYENYSYSLSVRAPIYRKYNHALYAQGKAQAEVAEARLDKAGNDLAVSLVSSYMEALFADDQLRLIEAQKTSLRSQVEAAEKGYKAGTGTRIDIDEARAKYDMVLAQEIEVLNLRRHNRRVLSALVNRDIGDLSRLDLGSFQPLPPNPTDIDTWVSRAEAGNAEYQGLLAQARAAEEEVEKALAGHHPTLDFVASLGKNGNESLSSLNTRYKTASYGVQLNIPLVAGGQTDATVRQARAKLEQTRQQVEEARRNIGVQTRREFDNVVQGIAQIRALERAEASARQTVASARKGVEAGIRSTLDVLEVDQQHFAVLRDLAQARYKFLVAGMRLKAMAAVLAEADIVGVDRQLERR